MMSFKWPWKRQQPPSTAPSLKRQYRPDSDALDSNVLEIVLNFLSDSNDVIRFSAVCNEWRQVVLSSSDRRNHTYSNRVAKKGVMTHVCKSKWGDLPTIFQSLEFTHCDLSDGQFREIYSSPHVNKLKMQYCRVPILDQECQLTSLTIGCYYGSKIAKKLQVIAQRMIHLTYLSLEYSTDEECLKIIANGKLTKLESLSLSNEYIDNKSVEYLFESDNLPALKSLYLDSERITNVESIEKAKFQLTDLDICALELHGSSVRNIITYGTHLTSLKLNFIDRKSTRLNSSH